MLLTNLFNIDVVHFTELLNKLSPDFVEFSQLHLHNVDHQTSFVHGIHLQHETLNRYQLISQSSLLPTFLKPHFSRMSP